MRLPVTRISILALVLAASPISLPSGSFAPADKPFVLAMSDVLTCDFPHHLPNDAVTASQRVNATSAPLWHADIYDLADCLRMKAEAI